MIRNGPEYVLPDGSPRYGIRTADAAPAQAATVPSLVRVGQTADAAALLDAAELKMAVQHRFVLDRFNQSDAAMISALRASFPDELEEAEAVVAKRLGSPSVWMRGARTAYTEAVVEKPKIDGTLVNHLVAALKSLGLSVAMLVIVIGLAVMDAPSSGLSGHPRRHVPGRTPDPKEAEPRGRKPADTD